VREHIGHVIAGHAVDLVIINGENAAGGFGLTPTIADELFDLGAHVITTGNHVWDKKEIIDYLKPAAPDSHDRPRRVLRPANYAPDTPGYGVYQGTLPSGQTYGRVTAVIGTHTHIPTADDRVLTNGTAYQTDVGMSGPYDSIIGVQKEMVLERFLTSMPSKFEAAKGDPRMAALLIECDPSTGHALSTERLLLGE
jgi:hypothetical protein